MNTIRNNENSEEGMREFITHFVYVYRAYWFLPFNKIIQMSEFVIKNHDQI